MPTNPLFTQICEDWCKPVPEEQRERLQCAINCDTKEIVYFNCEGYDYVRYCSPIFDADFVFAHPRFVRSVGVMARILEKGCKGYNRDKNNKLPKISTMDELFKYLGGEA
jgi:hypothetical protein